MDRFVVVSCLALVVVVFGLVGAVSFWPHAAPAGGAYTADDAISAARQFVTADSTYKYDGMTDTLQVSLNRTIGDGSYEVVAGFTSRNSGYGDRTSMIIAPVLTTHRAVITVDNGTVTSAVMDGQWDMMTRQMTESGAR